MPHFMIVLLLYINLLNISWIKMSSFEEHGAFKWITFTTPWADSADDKLMTHFFIISQENRI